jgi:hypothetical protein
MKRNATDGLFTKPSRLLNEEGKDHEIKMVSRIPSKMCQSCHDGVMAFSFAANPSLVAIDKF